MYVELSCDYYKKLGILNIKFTITFKNLNSIYIVRNNSEK